MRHLDDGTLRRMYDEPFTISSSQRQHYAACERCQRTFDEIAGSARRSEALLALPEVTPNPTLALAQMRRRIAAGEARRPAAWPARLTSALQRQRSRMLTPFGGMVAAAALVTALMVTPAGSLAQTFITIFQPQQIVAVPVSSSDLRNLPKLAKYGTVHAPAKLADQQVSSATAASTLSGMQVLTPASLPAGVPQPAQYDVVPGSTGTFTFDAAKAQRAAAAQGKTLPPMPARINGSTLQISVGTAVATTYGASKTMPTLVIGQMQAPRVSSTGVSVKEIEDYVLSLPGVSPQLAQAIESVNDPTTTLPIPIPVDLAHSQTVQVQGVQGVEVGDSTGLGSGVIWQKDGVIYGVGGTLPMDQIMAVANSLR